MCRLHYSPNDLFAVPSVSLPSPRCVFLPDNGAFFVNYVITASLIGTAMELLRIPALAVYTARLCLAKSKAERIHLKRVSPPISCAPPLI